jgi:hypothetical protein
MTIAIGTLLLGVGATLVILGWLAPDPGDPPRKRTYFGLPADKIIWLLLGGVASGLLGLMFLT